MLYDIIKLLPKFGEMAELVVQQPESPSSTDIEEQWLVSIDTENDTYNGLGFTIEEAAESLMVEVKRMLGL
ncbi:MAG: hypothetical protein E6Q36_00220 [Chryseobacterium sp.]|nr:MAG: hypothetical protein E6Q36_00220 [Chryseobacterium sp.]